MSRQWSGWGAVSRSQLSPDCITIWSASSMRSSYIIYIYMISRSQPVTDSISQIVVLILSHELFKKHIICNVVCSISV